MTPQEFAKKIQTTVAKVERDVPNLLLLGGKLLEGEMKQRIFNQGGDADGGKIGKYKSKQWIQKRSESGRQTGLVDLEFTGSLRDSIQVVKSGDEVFLAITNATDYVKAKGQEQRRKKPIFIPSAEERTDVENYLNDLIFERVLGYF
jgi:hypothetical protein